MGRTIILIRSVFWLVSDVLLLGRWVPYQDGLVYPVSLAVLLLYPGRSPRKNRNSIWWLFFVGYYFV